MQETTPASKILLVTSASSQGITGVYRWDQPPKKYHQLGSWEFVDSFFFFMSTITIISNDRVGTVWWGWGSGFSLRVNGASLRGSGAGGT